uniref:Dual specificity protein phosphatase 8-like n=1 Tax=Callorhinchus milii TaxID=7868 RepID=A0A4W3H459_CALMI
RDLVLYDQRSHGVCENSATELSSALTHTLEKRFQRVYLLKGGFAVFSSAFPSLCEGKSPRSLLSSCSQPCLSALEVGPTQIFPHLYLGSQSDVLNKEVMVRNRISHVLNVSSNCVKPNFIPDTHFLRIPIDDSYRERLLPWILTAVQFIGTRVMLQGRVLVHCWAGVSRSPAIAIAYVMNTSGLPLDDAYRFVKDRRASISPNFNFLGQLVEFERNLETQRDLCPRGPPQEGSSPLPLTRSERGTGPDHAPRYPSPRTPNLRGEDDPEWGRDGLPENAVQPRDPLEGVRRRLRLSLWLPSEASSGGRGMSRSVSLDASPGCYPTASPVQTGPVPKLLGFRGARSLAIAAFNPFALLFGNGRKEAGGKGKCQPAPGSASLDQAGSRWANHSLNPPTGKHSAAPPLTLNLPAPWRPASELSDYGTVRS